MPVTMEALPGERPDCAATFELEATVDSDAETIRYEVRPFAELPPTLGGRPSLGPQKTRLNR
jgi:hypothetical protein